MLLTRRPLVSAPRAPSGYRALPARPAHARVLASKRMIATAPNFDHGGELQAEVETHGGNTLGVSVKKPLGLTLAGASLAYSSGA